MLPCLVIDKQTLSIVLVEGKLNWFRSITPLLFTKDTWQSLKDGGQDAWSHATVHQVELFEIFLAFKPVDNRIRWDLLNVKPTNLHTFHIPLHRRSINSTREYLFHDHVRI